MACKNSWSRSAWDTHTQCDILLVAEGRTGKEQVCVRKELCHLSSIPHKDRHNYRGICAHNCSFPGLLFLRVSM